MRIALISVPILGVIQLSHAVAVARRSPSSEEIVGLSKSQPVDALAPHIPFNQVTVIEPTSRFTKRASGDEKGNSEVSPAPRSLSSPEIQKLIADNRKKVVAEAEGKLDDLRDEAEKRRKAILAPGDTAERRTQVKEELGTFGFKATQIATKAQNEHNEEIQDLAEESRPDPEMDPEGYSEWLRQVKEAKDGWTGVPRHDIFGPRPPKSSHVGTEHPLSSKELTRMAEVITKHAYY